MHSCQILIYFMKCYLINILRHFFFLFGVQEVNDVG